MSDYLNRGTLEVVWFSFFITKRCSKTMLLCHHFACSCFLVGREEVNNIATRVPYLWLKKEWVRKAKMHRPSNDKRTLILVCVLSKVLSKNTKTKQLHARWYCDKILRPKNNQLITYYLCVCNLLRIQQYPVNTTYNSDVKRACFCCSV